MLELELMLEPNELPKLLPARHVPSDCAVVPDGQFATPPELNDCEDVLE